MKRLGLGILSFMILAAMMPMGLSSCCTGDVRTDVVILSQDEWVGMLNSTFSDISLRINNYTPVDHEFRPEDEFAFFKPDDSFLRIASLGLDFGFEIPVQRSDPYSLYVNDINSTGFTAGARARKALITIDLEDEGTEIIGNCVNNFFCFCGDPKIDLDDATIEIFLTLGARSNNLVIEAVEAELTAGFSESGPCVDNACAFACDIFAPDREGLAKTSIETQVENFLMNNRAILETLFNNFLETRGIEGRITSVVVGSGGELIITEQTDEPCTEV